MTGEWINGLGLIVSATPGPDDTYCDAVIEMNIPFVMAAERVGRNVRVYLQSDGEVAGHGRIESVYQKQGKVYANVRMSRDDS